MRIIIILFISQFVLINTSFAKDKEFDISNSWFKPKVNIDNDSAACNVIMSSYLDYFKSYSKENPIKAMYRRGWDEFKAQKLSADMESIKWSNIGDKNSHDKYRIAEWKKNNKYYAVVEKTNTQGWRRPRYQYFIINKPVDKNKDTYDFENDISAIKLSVIIKSKNDNIFDLVGNKDGRRKKYNTLTYVNLASVLKYKDDVLLLLTTNKPSQDTYYVFSLKDEKRLNLKCEFETLPSKESLAQAESELPDLKKFKGTTFDIMGDAGSCGTLNSHGRASYALQKLFNKLLYRPWGINGQVKLKYDFELWANSGVWNNKKYLDFKTQLPKAVNSLSDFYTKNYALTKNKSIELAQEKIQSLLAIGFNHGRTRDENNILHEKLIKGLVGKTRNEVFDLLPDPDVFDKSEKEESLFSFSINHPSIIRQLIKKGYNVNKINAFGKTPLMYAAQFNQYETAKILLDAGANPNAKTTRATDNCFYTIRTFNMTPLHYSVRYASTKFVKLLIDRGAVNFIKAENANKRPHTRDSISNWLALYTNENSKEKNVNIPDGDIDLIQSWLKINSTNKLTLKAKDYILDAERLYQNKKISKAYEMIGLALEIEPGNMRALSDMSLIALKSGNLGESIEAGNKLLTQNAPKKLKANALFNQGLACEKYLAGRKWGMLSYNGKYYCRNGFFYSFYNSLKLHSTKARKNKIIEIFSNSINYCDIASKNIKINFQYGKEPYNHKYKRTQTLFALLKKGNGVTGYDLSWNQKYSGVVVPEQIDSIEIDEYTLAVFNAPRQLNLPYTFFGHKCLRK